MPVNSDLIRLLRQLLEGLSLHAPDGAAEDVSRFRASLAAVSEGLTDETRLDEIPIALQKAIRALEEHNGLTSKFIKSYAEEMQAMIAMMAGAIKFLAASSQAGVDELHAVEQSLESASRIDDIREVRLKLSDCLAAVKNETVRLRDESQKQIQVLEKTIESANINMFPVSDEVDAATGLRGRSQAERMIASHIREGKTVTIALFLVDRLAAINLRFGRKAGDEVLRMAAQHLKKSLPQECAPFRWSGPSFLVLIGSAQAAKVTERDIRKIAATRLEKNIESANRSVLLPVSCSVIMEKIEPGDAHEEVCSTLDDFAAR